MKEYQIRESWKSRLGFIFAALGSAVGLGSIWRFPYVVGENGGGAFIFAYLICLALIGFPVLIGEILIGRAAQSSPAGAFRLLGRTKYWAFGGKTAVVTGFLISSFYSVIAGWSLGYLVQAISGRLSHFTGAHDATACFTALSASSAWTVGFHLLFMALSLMVLLTGVRKGIELGSKIMMPLLVLVLLILVVKALTMPGAMAGLSFLFKPEWRLLTPRVLLVALGQAFFTLSLGQGTMVTYGSYLSRDENVAGSCYPVVLLNTVIALLMGVAIFPIVFSAGMQPQIGSALIFETLPLVFSEISFGWALSILFFTLVALAALTSEVSALEPVISYLMDEKGFSRKKAAIAGCSAAFLLGIPSALAFGLWKSFTLFGYTFFDLISSLSINLLVPIGGLMAVVLVGWRWGMAAAFDNLKIGSHMFDHGRHIAKGYFYVTLKYIAPVMIIFVLLNVLGVF